MPTPAEKVAMELIRFHREELYMDWAENGRGTGPTLWQRVMPRLDNNESLYLRALRMVNREDA